MELLKENELNLSSKDGVSYRCPVIYEECDFKGKGVEICSSIPDWAVGKVKSIRIPEG